MNQTTPHPDLDALVLQDAESDGRALIAAARAYAFAALAGPMAHDQRAALRRIFGPVAPSLEDLEEHAPFAVDHDLDNNARSVRVASMKFAIARTPSDRLDALEEYSLGYEHAAASYTLTSADRLLLIAWAARAALVA